MTKKSVKWDDVRESLLSDPEVQKAYEDELRKERLQAILEEWRKIAGLTRAQVAERMGVQPPTVSKMEGNICKASIDTLARYAHACGIKKPKIIL
ncbi:MAG: helix-turn-helix domain-containing protein [Enterovibrio sp.]